MLTRRMGSCYYNILVGRHVPNTKLCQIPAVTSVWSPFGVGDDSFISLGSGNMENVLNRRSFDLLRI